MSILLIWFAIALAGLLAFMNTEWYTVKDYFVLVLRYSLCIGLFMLFLSVPYYVCQYL